MIRWGALFSWLYRERCVACRAWAAEPLCPACQAAWPIWRERCCPVCAEPLLLDCRACAAHPPRFDGATALAPYAGTPRAAIKALKYRRRRRLGAWLGHRLAAYEGLPEGDWLVVPVPLHPQRARKRGYNQAALIAKTLARVRGWPYAEALGRVLATDPQHGLARTARRANLEGAFICRRPVAGARVLLVDDVLTTGATADAAASALKAAGAVAVHLAVVARTLPPRYRDGEVLRG